MVRPVRVKTAPPTTFGGPPGALPSHLAPHREPTSPGPMSDRSSRSSLLSPAGVRFPPGLPGPLPTESPVRVRASDEDPTTTRTTVALVARLSPPVAHRQPHGERAPLPQLAAGVDGAAVGFDDPADYGEAEAGAAGVAAAAGVDAVEAVEDVWEVLRWDAGAGVSHH